jgi:Na+-transporting methylmalonyl-CoA/oxaloacetate decarboxylase beta subunit
MIITLVSAVFNFVMPVYLSHKFHINAGEVSSIGIIGGSDGPTSILVTRSNSYAYLSTIIFTVLSVVGVVYRIYTKKTTK